jgi:ubiquinone/menaquinone biosynthesis C-methylase UbiE
MKQSDAFLSSEGDAWYARNRDAGSLDGFPDSDRLLAEMVRLVPPLTAGSKVLEIGCADGLRLHWLKQNIGCECHGIEPSATAVAVALRNGVLAHRGTADRLPYADKAFDVVMFGFCLYLCDRQDLFRIAAEADRVLGSPGWLLILDFYSPHLVQRDYHHRKGLFSYKMDYPSLFTWDPSYTVYSHTLGHHERGVYTDDPAEWVATSVLRKNPRAHG